MFDEFERVMLTTDLPDRGLREGATGTIVDVHRNPDAYMVEFTANGETIAVVAVNADQVRRVTGSKRPMPRRAGNVAAR